MYNNHIDATPNPQFLIKSIAEQGYSLETALADLIDNSITAEATRIDIVTFLNPETNKICLFIADNGIGMSNDELIKNMKFPSSDMDCNRSVNDLGRFGLGLKTASFSQTRKFTVLSKEKKENNQEFNGLTWDVDELSEKTGWIMFKETQSAVLKIIENYESESKKDSLNCEEFNKEVNTLVYWDNLRKFNNYQNFNIQIDIVKEYLGIVFHRSIDSNKLVIRFNSEIIKSFNPFPDEPGLGGLKMDESQCIVNNGNGGFKMSGFVVNPDYEKNEAKWTTKNRSLFDLEGLYIYRNDRLIFFGGWNGIRKRTAKLKLARLKMDFNNSNDTFFLLNVDKSKVSLFSVKKQIADYVDKLEELAHKQYYNRVISETNKNGHSSKIDIIKGGYNSKGRIIEFNNSFPLLKKLNESLDTEQSIQLKAILKIIQVTVNTITRTHEDKNIISVNSNESDLSNEEIKKIIIAFSEVGCDKDEIELLLTKKMGYEKTSEIKELIKENIKK
jgi:hypothetical protein